MLAINASNGSRGWAGVDGWRRVKGKKDGIVVVVAMWGKEVWDKG